MCHSDKHYNQKNLGPTGGGKHSKVPHNADPHFLGSRNKSAHLLQNVSTPETGASI